MRKKRILYIGLSLPDPAKSSGSLRASFLLDMLVNNEGCLVYAIGWDGITNSVGILGRIGVECVDYSIVDDRSRTGFERIVKQIGPDIVIFVTYKTLEALEWLVRKNVPAAKIILDTTDLEHVRFKRQAELSGLDNDRSLACRAYQEEWDAIRRSDAVWVVTEDEKRIIDNKIRKPCFVIPNIHKVAEISDEQLCAKSGVVFIGSYNHAPNVDAVRYFVDEIWGNVLAELPDAQFKIIGPDFPDSLGWVRDVRGVTVSGFVDDHRLHLIAARVGIAPLRFGAGMKGKIGEYLCCRCACVCSAIGAEGMGLKSGSTALISDSPQEFSRMCVQALTDDALFDKLTQNGVKYIENKLSPEVVSDMLSDALRHMDGVFQETGKWVRIIKHRLRNYYRG